MRTSHLLFPGILALFAALSTLPAAAGAAPSVPAQWQEPSIPCTAPGAVVLGRDLDGDGDPDEIEIHLEIDEIQEEVYPGQYETFWVFSPPGEAMCSPARAPSPTIRVEEGDHVRIVMHNTHYFPHTIHVHGTIHPNAVDGVPMVTQAPTRPGGEFAYEFVAKHPGTFWYHCHVHPDVHVPMGLAGMLVIEPNRRENNFRHLIVGAGRIPDPARAVREAGYTKEYSLVYSDLDDRLNRIVSTTQDPREIERRMHRDYDSTQRQPNIFLLNGRSFPFTLRDTPIEVKPGDRVLLRILNAGARTLALHPHGHHPILLAQDGYDVPAAMRYARDVFTVSPAQRIDLELRAGSDDIHASGEGVWLFHDHTEQAVTNNGIGPGGDLTMIIYDSFMGKDKLPKVATSLKQFFNPDYYRGKVPVFDPSIFHTAPGEYPQGASGGDSAGKAPYPVRRDITVASDEAHELAEHRIIAKSCAQPRGSRRIHVKEGAQYARPGEVYGFEPSEIRAGRCEEVELVLENTDSVRHDMMIPGLDPMFALDFTGPGTRTIRFVTPDEDITLPFHCHVPAHEKMGMLGALVVGKGAAPKAAQANQQGPLHEGIGTVISTDLRKGRIVIDHKEIPGFMAAMTMSYAVNPATLLQGLKAREEVRFTIDDEQRAIVKIVPLK
ncbi:MAG: multicopper oxidase domain-containing protein [Burkholderiales bacterium]|nr:multicopper oxidase domain-containing protein [Burkholderiales bacterium]